MKEIINPDSASNIELNENKIHFQNEYQYNTYICSIPMDFASVPVHWHDEFEMIVIKKGRGTLPSIFRDIRFRPGISSSFFPECFIPLKVNRIRLWNMKIYFFQSTFLPLVQMT